jgi:bile acid-coenzyme A ligase
MRYRRLSFAASSKGAIRRGSVTATVVGEAISFGRRITELATADPDAVAAVFAPRSGPDQPITRRTLDARSTQVARLLAERGAGPGTLVAIGLPNSPEHLYVAIGAWKAGAGVLPIRADLPDWERARLLDVAQVVLLVGDAGESAVPIVTTDEVRASVDRSTDPLPDVVAEPAVAIASSGSTGRPKVIVSPLPGMAVPGATPPLAAEFFELPEHMPQLVPAPLYHTNGFSLAHSTLFAGDLMVLMEKFDAAQAVDLIERYQITCFAAVPTMLARMARVEGVRERDLSSIVYVMQGGATCPDWVVDAWNDLVGPEHLFMTYGSTERVGLTFMRGVDWASHRGSCGVGHNTDVRILDDEGNDLPPGEVGEIFMRQNLIDGPTFVYVGADAPRQTADGFTCIGDLGWLDADGYLHIADRRVDMIVSGGANVYPAEVEAALSEHPGVHDVVVVGLADPEWGHRVHAIVEPTDPAAPPDPADLDAHARARLAAYKVPKDYEIVARIPRSDAGKINRGTLAAERASAG